MSTDAPQTRPDYPTCQGNGHLVFFKKDDDGPREFFKEEKPAKSYTQECPDCHDSKKAVGS